jgi:hypothetical protein
MVPRSRKTSRFGNRSNDGERRGFDPERVPTGEEYFSGIFGPVRFNNNGWAQVRCCFHSPDRHPSLSIHRDGGFKCHACGIKGGSVIDFEMFRSGTNFKTAARDLGAWR